MSVDGSAIRVGSRPTIPALTSIRYFAAASVVLFHIVPHDPAVLPSALMNAIKMSGDAAVCFFFVLSGFILVYSDVSNTGNMRKTRNDFWRTRFARIYPVYFLAFLLAAIPAYWGLRSTHAASGAWLRMLLYGPAAALLVQSWLPWTSSSWNAPGWSLSCEAFFYAMFPALSGLYKFKTRTWMWILSGTWCLTILPTVLETLRYKGAAPPLLLTYAVSYEPLLRIPEFIAGMIVGMVWIRRHPDGPDPARRSAVPVVTLIAAIVGFALFARLTLPRAILLPLFLLLIYRFACDRSWLSRALSHRSLVRLGEASYSVYILHIPIWVYVTVFLHLNHTGLMTMAIYLVFITCVALATYKWIEMPWMQRLRPPRSAMAR